MAEHPIMPLIVASLIGDTTHFENEELGAYVRILCAMWLNGGMIRERDVRKISQLSPYRFAKSFSKISEKLYFADGFVSQKRLSDMWLKSQSNRRRASEAARLSWTPGYTKRPLKQKLVQQLCERNAIVNKKKEREEGAADDPSWGLDPDPTGGHPFARPDPGPLRASDELTGLMVRKARAGG